MNRENFKKVVTNKWFFHAVGLLCVAILVWFVGPLIAIADSYILESVASRLLAIIVITLIWFGVQAFKYYLKRKNDKAFAENLTLKSAKADEVAIIQERFNEAISFLKAKSKKGSGGLNSLPWYIIIGPPGSGKTTALLNSGLEFPLKDKLGADAIKGIGGTRHCDWWFTNEAVLIDTAGRFTTQDSDSEIDKTAWQSFMSMLKKHRAQRPINGALVTMSLSDMLSMDEDELAYYAKTIRRRIDELSEQLSVNFPIYFMFTKCDLISGFSAFFSSLSAKQRNQVWGETFDLDSDGNSAFEINDYDLCFDAMLSRLQALLLVYLRQQNDPAKKADIVSFPSQMESMKLTIHKFLKDIFAQNRYQKSALLRGVYFTSGTQQGSPFDSLLGSIAADLGVTAEENINFSGRGKSFFIRDLLSQVIFEEAELAGVNQKRQRWIKRLQFASISAAILVFLGASIAWYGSYTTNLERIDQVNTNVSVQQKLVRQREDKVADFETVLLELNTAREAMTLFEPETTASQLGLSQKDSFDNQTKALYLSALETRLLPLIKHRLESIMLSILREGDKADLYSFLKAYLMYAGQHTQADAEFEPDWLSMLAKIDWQANYAKNPEIATQLTEHLDYMLAQTFQYIIPDEGIVGIARSALMQLPLENQVYASIKDFLLSTNEYDLAFNQLAGSDGAVVFRNKNGRPIEEMFIPGMFTKQGFQQNFLINSAQIADEYLANTWIMGEQNKQTAPSRVELQNQINKLYYKDYIAVWAQFIKNIDVMASGTESDSVYRLRTLGDLNSPLIQLIESIAVQTNLTSVPESVSAIAGAGEVVSAINSRAQRVISDANRVKRAADKADLMELPGQPVTQQFAEYHRLLGASSDGAIAQLQSDISQYTDFIQQTLNDSFSETPAFDAAIGRIQNKNRAEFDRILSRSSRNPEQVNVWLNKVADIGWQAVMSKASVEVSRIWQQQVYSVYDMAIANRYPFARYTEVAEVELIDFANFFAPNGVLPNFINRYIEPFVDTSGRWQLKSFGNTSLRLSASTLQQLQLANNITDVFFKKGAQLPSLSYSIIPVSLDTMAAKFVFSTGNQLLEYAHGPRRYTNFNWPPAASNETTKLEFITVRGDVKTWSEMGPWSLFKMLDQQTIENTSRNSTYSVTFKIDDINIETELRAESEFNPIGTRVLQSFVLPREL